MRADELLESVVELHSELETSEGIEQELLEQVRELDANIHQMIKSNELLAEESLTQQLVNLEAKFASEHPRLEGLTREVIDRLSHMGI